MPSVLRPEEKRILFDFIAQLRHLASPETPFVASGDMTDAEITRFLHELEQPHVLRQLINQWDTRTALSRTNAENTMLFHTEQLLIRFERLAMDSNILTRFTELYRHPSFGPGLLGLVTTIVVAALVYASYYTAGLKRETLLQPPSYPPMSSDCQGTEDSCDNNCQIDYDGDKHDLRECLDGCYDAYVNCQSTWASYTNQSSYVDAYNTAATAHNKSIEALKPTMIFAAVVLGIASTCFLCCVVSLSESMMPGWLNLFTAGFASALRLAYHTMRIMSTPYIHRRLADLPQFEHAYALRQASGDVGLAITDMPVSRIITILLLARICQQNPAYNEASNQRQGDIYLLWVRAWDSMLREGAASLRDSHVSDDDMVTIDVTPHELTPLSESSSSAPMRNEAVIFAALNSVRFFQEERYPLALEPASASSVAPLAVPALPHG